MKTLSLIIVLFFSTSLFSKQLIGKALLEYSVFGFDIYEISYFISPDGTQELLLDYKRDVERKYSLMGWKKSFEKKTPDKKSLAWILKNTVDFKKGDQFILRKKDSLVTLIKNKKTIAIIQDSKIAKIIHAPWIGENPIDKEIKRKLLKNLKKEKNEKARTDLTNRKFQERAERKTRFTKSKSQF